MRRHLLALFAILTLALTTHAQEKNSQPAQPPSTYLMKFILKEVENGKTINTRQYDMTIRTDMHTNNALRAGNRIPVVTATAEPSNATTSSAQVSYIDVGVNIDVIQFQTDGDKLFFNLRAEVSSMEPQATNTKPLIHQNRWNSLVTIPKDKPTVVFRSDDISSTRSTLLEVTANEIK